jgi:hypothetical protein
MFEDGTPTIQTDIQILKEKEQAIGLQDTVLKNTE